MIIYSQTHTHWLVPSNDNQYKIVLVNQYKVSRLVNCHKKRNSDLAMAKLAEIFLSLVALVICVQSDVVQPKNENVVFWGDLSTKIILGSSRAKTGFPLITRSFEVTYPEVFIY